MRRQAAQPERAGAKPLSAHCLRSCTQGRVCGLTRGGEQRRGALAARRPPHRSEAAGRPAPRFAKGFDRLSPILRYLRMNGLGRQPRKVRLNKAKVRPQASFACASSKRGVVSLLKPWYVPGYL